MSKEKIPVPKDKVNAKFLCCFPTRSWSGKRINGCQVVVKSYDEKEQIFILRLKGQELLVTLTKDLIKSLHTKKDDTYGFMDLKNEMVNSCRVVNKSYVENGPSFVLNLHGQVEPVTISRDLVKSLHAIFAKQEREVTIRNGNHLLKLRILDVISNLRKT
jgi:hypothetical protein